MQTEAIVINRHGGPEVLERQTIELPEPGPREVRVRVHAVSINHLDLWTRRGGPAFKLQFPHRLGSDIAGVVDALGPGARGATVGQRVMVSPGLSCGVCRACTAGRDNLCRSYRILGENTQGGYARHVNVPDQNLLPIGDTLGFPEAAAAPLVTLTAWQMAFHKAQLRPGQTVVVHAAGSGVSTILIQLAKLIGARVIATTGSPEKVERARALGADEVIDTSKSAYVPEIKRLTGKAGADVIFDHLGGTFLEQAVAAAAWGGRIVTCGATAGFDVKLDMRQIFFRQVEILGSTMGSKGDLAEALPLLLSGRLRAPVDRVVPLWEARAAHEALEARQVFGKVILAVD
ncbi:zinc-binding dehydrogenase [Chondromyces crocatus]|uniref:NADPH:quinone oxidoreductase n=1 Tax=Chondromyces crocatus TaxID=52 RepID=A0A0K1ES78_CHOCO|nr:zinc-binding dehydrogenase [Chondromyces crocatus]AKT43644.1 NADPH:quinone oxidoreductase [Chondromyces crocatus]